MCQPRNKQSHRVSHISIYTHTLKIDPFKVYHYYNAYLGSSFVPLIVFAVTRAIYIIRLYHCTNATCIWSFLSFTYGLEPGDKRSNTQIKGSTFNNCHNKVNRRGVVVIQSIDLADNVDLLFQAAMKR